MFNVDKIGKGRKLKKIKVDQYLLDIYQNHKERFKYNPHEDIVLLGTQYGLKKESNKIPLPNHLIRPYKNLKIKFYIFFQKICEKLEKGKEIKNLEIKLKKFIQNEIKIKKLHEYIYNKKEENDLDILFNKLEKSEDINLNIELFIKFFKENFNFVKCDYLEKIFEEYSFEMNTSNKFIKKNAKKIKVINFKKLVNLLNHYLINKNEDNNMKNILSKQNWENNYYELKNLISDYHNFYPVLNLNYDKSYENILNKYFMSIFDMNEFLKLSKKDKFMFYIDEVHDLLKDNKKYLSIFNYKQINNKNDDFIKDFEYFSNKKHYLMSFLQILDLDDINIQIIVSYFTEITENKTKYLEILGSLVKKYIKEKKKFEEEQFSLFDLANYIHNNWQDENDINIFFDFISYFKEFMKYKGFIVDSKHLLNIIDFVECFHKICDKIQKEILILSDFVDDLEDKIKIYFPKLENENLKLQAEKNLLFKLILQYLNDFNKNFDEFIIKIIKIHLIKINWLDGNSLSIDIIKKANNLYDINIPLDLREKKLYNKSFQDFIINQIKEEPSQDYIKEINLNTTIDKITKDSKYKINLVNQKKRSDNYTDEYNSILPNFYYKTLLEKKLKINENEKWYTKPHHIESLTKNNTSIKDNILDVNYISHIKKDYNKKYLSNSIKNKELLINTIENDINALKAKQNNFMNYAPNDKNIMNTLPLKPNYNIDRENISKNKYSLEVQSYEGILSLLRQDEKKILNKKREEEFISKGEPEKNWYNLGNKNFSQNYKKNWFANSKNFNNDNIQKLKLKELY